MGRTRKISTRKLSRREWLLLRKQGIGSSDVAAILGLNPYKTPLDVYLDKTSAEVSDAPLTPKMEWGLRLEDAIARKFADNHNCNVMRDDAIRIHPQYDFMRATLDRIVRSHPNETGKGILELKTAHSQTVSAWQTEIPLMYFSQVQHQLFVTGFKWAAIAFLIDGSDYKEFFLRPDSEYIQKQNDILFRFWHENVTKHQPPPPMVADLEKLKPVASAVEASDEIADLCRELAALKAELNRIGKEKEELEDKLKQFIGEHEELIHRGIRIATWKQYYREPYIVHGGHYRVLKLNVAAS